MSLNNSKSLQKRFMAQNIFIIVKEMNSITLKNNFKKFILLIKVERAFTT